MQTIFYDSERYLYLVVSLVYSTELRQKISEEQKIN